MGQQGFVTSTPVRGEVDPFVVGLPIASVSNDESLNESDSTSDFEYLTEYATGQSA